MIRKISITYIFLFVTLSVCAASIPTWMQERIHKDLGYYKQGLASQDLATLKDLVYQYKLPLLHIQIINNKLHYDHPTPIGNKEANAKAFVVNYLTRLLKIYKLPNVSFFINLHEQAGNLEPIFNMKKKLAPVMVFAKDRTLAHSKSYVLFPDDFTIADRGYGYWAGWKTTSRKILTENKNLPWEAKTNTLFWRGKKSDYWEGKSFNTPRQILINLSEKYPDLIYARFNEVPIKGDSKFMAKISGLVDLIIRKFGLLNAVTDEEFFKYKIRANIDGSTCTFPGFLKNLLSNSVTLKQTTTNEQWFYDAVKPWVHYIPIKQDLSDLVEKIEWIRTHDTEAKRIADASTEFVQHNLMMEHVDMYVIALLTEYAKLQHFTLNETPKNVRRSNS